MPNRDYPKFRKHRAQYSSEDELESNQKHIRNRCIEYWQENEWKLHKKYEPVQEEWTKHNREEQCSEICNEKLEKRAHFEDIK